VTVKIKDKGRGIEDIELAMEPMFTTGGAERAGLGFAVMKQMSDSVKVRSQPGHGTTVTLTWKIASRRSLDEQHSQP
jgi:stage II sporulation protein AB (anti-sigma F factor)